MKKIAVVHTSFVSHLYLSELFRRMIPEAEVFNIVDDSLLKEVTANEGVTPAILRRMCKYFDIAAVQGADLIFNQCSSVGEAAMIAAKTVSVPVLRIDEAMAEEAVSLGTRIGVVATVSSTVLPSCNLVKERAQIREKSVEVVPYLVPGALDILMREGQEKHNALVMDTLRHAERECDVLVLAQGSMVVLIPELGAIQKPVLTSPELGVKKARRMLLGA